MPTTANFYYVKKIHPENPETSEGIHILVCHLYFLCLLLELNNLSLLVAEPSWWKLNIRQNLPIWYPPLYITVTFEPLIQQEQEKKGKKDTGAQWKENLFDDKHNSSRCEKRQKKNHMQGLRQNYFTQNTCVKNNQCEFATEQCKMCLTTTMSRRWPPHNYGGNNYVKNYNFPSF